MAGSTGRGLEALRHRDFRLLWTAEFFSLAGTQMMRTAVAWHLFVLTGDPFQLGLLGIARFVPLLLFGLAGGVVADRGDRRRTLLVCQWLLLAVSAGLALLTAADRATPTAIYATTALAAAIGAVAGPTRQALVPALVPPAHLPGAMAMNALSFQVGGVAGPALGGMVLAAAGPAAVYTLDALSFGVVGVALTLIAARPVARPTISGWPAALEGLRFLRATPILLGVMTLDFVATFFGASTVLMPIFAERVFGGGPGVLGVLLAAPAAGAVVAGAAMTVLPLPSRPGLGVLVAVAAYGGCILAFGLVGSLPLALLALAGSGAADAVSMALRHTLRTLVTPNALRGRIAAAHSLFAMGGPQLGEFESGVAAAAIGAPAAVALGGAGVLAAAALVGWRVPAIAAWGTAAPVAPSDEPAREPTADRPAAG